MLSTPQWHFIDYLIQEAPEVPGVFTLWRSGRLIYVGKAMRPATIRSVLLHHLAGLSECTRTATHYSWEMSCTPEERAEDFIARWIAAGNPLPRCNEP